MFSAFLVLWLHLVCEKTLSWRKWDAAGGLRESLFTGLRSATGIKLLSGANKAEKKVGAKGLGLREMRHRGPVILGYRNLSFHVCFVFRGKLASPCVTIWCWNKRSGKADSELVLSGSLLSLDLSFPPSYVFISHTHLSFEPFFSPG